MVIKQCLSVIVAVVMVVGVVITPRQIQAEPYFQGKTITLIVSFDPGGRIDRQTRTVAKFLAKYVPGKPDLVVQNIPGGSGIPANQRFIKSKPDGSVIMMSTGRDLETVSLGLGGYKYDPLKSIWIGSVSTGKQRQVLITHKRAGFKTLEDLKSRELIMGAPRVGHRAYLYGRLVGEVLDLKIRWVIGYSTTELDLAIERGEVESRMNDASTIMTRRPDWIKQRLIVPHVALALPEYLPPLDDPIFANVPSLMDYTKNEIHRDIIRRFNTTHRLSGSLALPPQTPDSIRRILEAALLKAGEDPQFQGEWETFVLRGTKFGGVYSGDEVVKSVRIYTQWKPEVYKAYRRLGYQPPE